MTVRFVRRTVGTGVLVAADALVLVGCRADAGRVARELRSPQRWIATVGSDVAAGQAAGALLWVLALWLAVGLLTGVAQRLPGRIGRACDAVAHAVLPSALYRVVASTAGLGIVIAPALAIGAQSAVAQSARGPAVTAPAWPTDSPVPAPAWPTDPPPPASAAAPAHHTDDERVVVQPGDSLWRIAADHLPTTASDARVAQEWPRWFAANHRVIGADPNHLVPGQVLHAPEEDS